MWTQLQSQQEDSPDPLDSQSKLIGELQDNQKPCLKRGGLHRCSLKGQKTEGNNTQDCPQASTNLHESAYVPTHKHLSTHTHKHRHIGILTQKF